MPCYTPLTGWQQHGGGRLSFTPNRPPNARELKVACGRCIGCKLERSRQWGVRSEHETRFHTENCSITLTYSDEHLPPGGTLVPKHWVDFMKRLRENEARKNGRLGVRFYMGGEYGETNPETGLKDGGLYRPHYHAILFGMDFNDKKYYQTTDQGHTLWTSERLERIWGMGFCTTGAATFQSAAYIARYCTKKITGPKAAAHYQGKHPEFSYMSKGLGKQHAQQHLTDIYNWDSIIINGKECKPPRYYDKILQATNPDEYERVKAEREESGDAKRWDNTPQRLAVKHQVKLAAINNLTRKL